MFTKKSLSFFAFMLPLICTGQVVNIKLNCEMTLNKTYKTGPNERTQITEIFEVTQNGNFLQIMPNSTFISALSTQKIDSTISIINHSDNNKWSLRNVEKNGQHDMDTLTTIDRNTGIISYLQTFSNDYGKYWVRTDGTGNCKKVDTTQRRF